MIKPYIYKPTDGAKDNSRIIPALFPALLLLILIFQWKTLSDNMKYNSQTLGAMSSDSFVYDSMVNVIQKKPNDAQRSFELGRFFLTVNQDKEAEVMFLRAYTLGMDEAVLRPFWQLLDDREESPSALQEKLDMAQKTVAERPRWRDGWMLVAQYAFLLRKFDVSRDSLNRVFVLDPTFEPAQELLNIVEKLSQEH